MLDLSGFPLSNKDYIDFGSFLIISYKELGFNTLFK